MGAFGQKRLPIAQVGAGERAGVREERRQALRLLPQRLENFAGRGDPRRESENLREAAELSGEVGEYLRQRGNEFGTSTGRPRRTGWLDTVVARTGVELSGASFFAVTKLDVLDRLPEIPVCIAYELDGRRITEFPADVEDVERLKPVYETLPGWESETVGITKFEDLPGAARAYVSFLEERCGATAVAVSTGPRREETILRAHDQFWDRLPSR